MAVSNAQDARGGDEGRGRRACCETPACPAEASRQMRCHAAPGAPSVPSRNTGASLRSCTRSLSLRQRSQRTLAATMLIAMICDIREFLYLSADASLAHSSVASQLHHFIPSQMLLQLQLSPMQSRIWSSELFWMAHSIFLCVLSAQHAPLHQGFL